MIDIKIDLLNLQMTNFLRSRYIKLGRLKGGLYRYYECMLNPRGVLREGERCVIQYIAENFRSGARIHEMMAGAAQLGHALSLMGYDVTASERDHNRYCLAVELGKYVESNCEVRNRDFTTVEGDFDILVAVNAVASLDVKKAIEYMDSAIECSGTLIFNPDLFGEAGGGQLILDMFAGRRITKIGDGMVVL